jgi:hypothetical protein
MAPSAGFASHVPRSEQTHQVEPVSEKSCELAERKSRDEIIAGKCSHPEKG